MKLLLPALAILVLLILPQAAQAQSANQFAKVSEVFVNVDDDVSDGCLPSPNVLKVEAELILHRSGVRVFDDNDGFRHVLKIFINGFELTVGPDHPLTGDCTAAVFINLARWERLEDGAFGEISVIGILNSYFGPKHQFQKQLRDGINEMVTHIADKILKARGQ